VYLASHGSDPKIIPIDFGETIAMAAPTENSIPQRVRNFVRIPEALPPLAESPSQAVLDAIRGKLDGRRRDRTGPVPSGGVAEAEQAAREARCA
jgi:hypothetical protein